MITKFIPFLSWIKGYDKKKFLGDLPAGVTVGIMLIPQGMAYAMIAGLPPVYGLYAALVPQVIYAFLGTSRQLSVGPVAMDSLLVATGLTVIAQAGTENYILLAITLAFMMGVMQFLMGAFRLGFLVNFLSKPVISGFTSAAALIIGLSQLKYLMGVELSRSNKIHELLYNAAVKISDTNWVAFLVGIIGIVVIKVLKRITPKLPAALIVVVLGILSVLAFNLTDYDLNIIKDIPVGFPEFSMPLLDSETLSELFPIALTLALIAFMEAISVAKAIEQKHTDYKVNANQELIALGAANILGSFFQSYPTTGGFSRTAVNDQAGAKTGVSALISALVVGLTLLFLTPLFYYLPKAILASIIMVAVFGLIDFKYPIRLWKRRKDEFSLLIFTFVITLTVGIKEGIVFGVIFSVLLLVYRTSRPHIAILGQIPNTSLFRNLNRFPNAGDQKDVLIIRFDAQLYFANAMFFQEKIEQAAAQKGDNIKQLILSAEAINYLDSSAAEMLSQLIKDFNNKGVNVSIAATIGPVRDILVSSGIKDQITSKNIFNTVLEALNAYNNTEQDPRFKQLKEVANQTNRVLNKGK